MAQLADQDQVVRHLNKTLSRVATYGTEFFPVQVRFFFSRRHGHPCLSNERCHDGRGLPQQVYDSNLPRAVTVGINRSKLMLIDAAKRVRTLGKALASLW